MDYLPPGVDRGREVTGRKVSSVDRYLILSDYPPKNAGHYYTPPFWKPKQSCGEADLRKI
ncbi:hypothetical protein [Gloeobacter violaceus]|uniref:hypothetical protein n=1 Tax=Gloeobacter violaceus TaxID=33072 RepID=UPI0013E8D915|nr:hypothetical protein [Gloeobacter violaceus]